MPRNATKHTQTRSGTLTGMKITNGWVYIPVAQPGIFLENGVLRFPSAPLGALIASTMGSGNQPTPTTGARRGRPAGSSNKGKTVGAGV
jgi:hypothetical protein